MRALSVIAALLLTACASAGGASYSAGQGVASYDALKAAKDKCTADGGTLTLKDGYEKSDLSSWVCKMSGAK